MGIFLFPTELVIPQNAEALSPFPSIDASFVRVTSFSLFLASELSNLKHCPDEKGFSFL